MEISYFAVLMKKVTALLKVLLIGIVCMDILWLFFPEMFDRKYAIVLAIPSITICYFLYTELKNLLYLAALACFMIADYFFFVEGSLANGLTSSVIAMGIYGAIVLNQSHYISTRRILIFTIPFLIVYMLPFVFFVDQISDIIFKEVIFYSFTIGYFSFMSTLAYFSRKNKITFKLFLSGVATALMGIMFGIYLFVESKPLYAVIANMLFVYSHYKMWQYIIIKDSLEARQEV
ncbi:hypothetical protein [Kordia zhangzhouensis]|uniref:hypothetical protein n=1 Tax=Kordia zhangzhouensis TaxID=1620405 RepID=UPI0012FAAC26|nr:hypothetical protein [Kordia zhangzhouensis]